MVDKIYSMVEKNILLDLHISFFLLFSTRTFVSIDYCSLCGFEAEMLQFDMRSLYQANPSKYAFLPAS